MTIEIVIDLDISVHDEASKTVKVEDICWMTGHTSRPGCCVVMKNGVRYKSTNDSITLRNRIEEAKANDTESRRG